MVGIANCCTKELRSYLAKGCSCGCDSLQAPFIEITKTVQKHGALPHLRSTLTLCLFFESFIVNLRNFKIGEKLSSAV